MHEQYIQLYGEKFIWDMEKKPHLRPSKINNLTNNKTKIQQNVSNNKSKCECRHDETKSDHADDSTTTNHQHEPNPVLTWKCYDKQRHYEHDYYDQDNDHHQDHDYNHDSRKYFWMCPIFYCMRSFSVERFLAFLLSSLPHLNILINNGAQT